jgi:hypothetical protein
MLTLRRNSEEKGQILILSVLAFTVVFVIGAIVVDLGLWLSERRGSQTDADFLALQGAWELLDPNATDSDVNAAVDDALGANDGEANLTLDNGTPVVDWEERCVTVDVDHESRSLFFSIFGIFEPEIGAHARACAGPVSGGGNLIPLQLDNDTGPCFDNNEEPVLTTLCPLEFGAQGGPNGPNPRGILDLQAPEGYCSNSNGDGDIEELIEWGAAGPCLINPASACPGSAWIDCAATQTGNPTKVLDGMAARLARDGMCDGADANSWDDFLETVVLIVDNSPSGPGPEDIYGPRDCDPSADGVQMSPRLVTIIVFEEYPDSNNTPYPIVGLASVYISGCAPKDQVVNSEDDLNRYCTNPGVLEFGDLSGLFVAAPELGAMPRPAFSHCGPGVGHGNQPTCAPTSTPDPPTPTPTASPFNGPCGHGNQPTCTPTPTPGPPTPTPTPTQPPIGPPGHVEVYGRIFNFVVAGGSGGPSGGGGSSTAVGIYLVE